MRRSKATDRFLECPACGHDLQGTEARICPECDNDVVLAAQPPATFNWAWLITVFAVAFFLYTSFKAGVSLFTHIQLYDSKWQGFVGIIDDVWRGVWYGNMLDAWVIFAPFALLLLLVARKRFMSWPRGIQYGTMICSLAMFLFDQALTMMMVLCWGP
jgi:hypothetical protein